MSTEDTRKLIGSNVSWLVKVNGQTMRVASGTHQLYICVRQAHRLIEEGYFDPDEDGDPPPVEVEMWEGGELALTFPYAFLPEPEPKLEES